MNKSQLTSCLKKSLADFTQYKNLNCKQPVSIKFRDLSLIIIILYIISECLGILMTFYLWVKLRV